MKSKDLYNSLFKKYDVLTLTDAIEALSKLQINLTKYLKRSVFIKEPLQLDIDDVSKPLKENLDKEFFAKEEFVSFRDRENLKEAIIETDIILDQLKIYFGFEGENIWRLKEKLKKKLETNVKKT